MIHRLSLLTKNLFHTKFSLKYSKRAVANVSAVKYKENSHLQGPFEDLGISSHFIKALNSHFDVHAPTFAQKNFIPTILSGSDVFLRDVTGSGKTLGLLLAILSKSFPKLHASATDSIGSKKYLSTLILVPTRDLALQMTQWIRLLCQHVHPSEMHHTVQCIISGVEKNQQQMLLKTTPKIIVGTPVRTLELLESSDIDISRLQLFVIDEVDQLITVPTKYSPKKKILHRHPGESLIEKIIRTRKAITHEYSKKTTTDVAKKTRLQVVACSATLNHRVKSHFAHKEWMHEPVLLDATGNFQPPQTLSHEAYVLKPDGLYDFIWHIEPLENPTKNVDTVQYADDDIGMVQSLAHLIESEKLTKGFIFANASISMRRLVQKCKDMGLDAARLMDITDYEKQSLQGHVPVKLPDWIVLTEHEARGLDLPQACCVFILGLPSSPASYLHMAGRTARANNKGRVITLLGGERFAQKFKNLMSLLNIKSHKSISV